jgi:hypothetical protein
MDRTILRAGLNDPGGSRAMFVDYLVPYITDWAVVADTSAASRVGLYWN